ncbi:protein ZNRD2 isoform X3 [Acanthochromis polyacanthus]|uniref:protein ZNRD2 isoform X3 n=1 Tax=Acanthochromis polyacanthus TaxID=80966 RepID=UPI0022348B38|nr:protein ZNRD2 isoform X3 [Acanthochromis polyacanthus]
MALNGEKFVVACFCKDSKWTSRSHYHCPHCKFRAFTRSAVFKKHLKSKHGIQSHMRREKASMIYKKVENSTGESKDEQMGVLKELQSWEGDEDFEWEPPSEAEMKVIQARRERQDKISKLMGDYLLKGYKMLGDCCDVCGTILLQDRQQKKYCVSCQELDSDIDKDNPALNAQAALSQVRERQLAAQSPAPSQTPELNGGPSNGQPSVSVPQPRPEHCEGAAAGGRALLPPPAVPPPPAAPSTTALAPTRPAVCPQNPALRPVLQEAEEAVLTKLRWATTQLQGAASLEASIQLCSLITSCASSLRSLKELSQ